MAGFPLTRLLNREFIVRVLREHEFTKAFENAQRDILELFKRIFPDAPRDGTTYGRRDGEWTQIRDEGAEVDLGYTPAATQGTVTNSAGDDAVIPEFNEDDAGLVPAPGTSDGSQVLYDNGWGPAAAPDPKQYFTAELVPWGNGFSYTLGSGALAVVAFVVNVTPTSGLVWRDSFSRVESNGGFNVQPWYVGNNAPFFVRGGSADLGGFSVRLVVGTRTPFGLGAFFAGVTSQPANQPTQPLSFENAVAFGGNEGDVNWQIMHSNGAAAYTKVDLGIARAANQDFEVLIAGSSAGFAVTVNQIASSGAKTQIYSGTITTNMPGTGTALGFNFGGRTGAFSFNGNGQLYGISARWTFDGAV